MSGSGRLGARGDGELVEEAWKSKQLKGQKDSAEEEI